MMTKWGWYLFLIPVTAIYAGAVFFTNGNTPVIVRLINDGGGFVAPNQLGTAFAIIAFRNRAPLWAFDGGALVIFFGAAYVLGWLLHRIQARWNLKIAIGAYIGISAIADALLQGALSIIDASA